MKNNRFTSLRPLILVFVIFNALLITGRSWLVRKGVDQEVLIIANLLLFLVSFISVLIFERSLENSNPQVSVRAMYGSFIIKFFVLAITAFVYIMITKKNVNKPALIGSAGLYIIYAGLETRILMRKLLTRKKNA